MIRAFSFSSLAIILFTVFIAGCDQEPDKTQPSPNASGEAEPSPSATSQAGSGQRIAFVSNRDGAYRLYTMDPDGGDIRKVSDQPVAPWPFSVSRDGTQVAVVGADVSGNQSPCVYHADVMGGNTELIVQVPPGAVGPLIMSPRWTDDGAVLVHGTDTCYAVPSAGGDVREESSGKCIDTMALAEDTQGRLAAVVGASLVVADGPNATPRVLDRVMAPKSEGEEGAGWDVLELGAMQSVGVTRPVWSPDGESIAYFDYDAGDGQRGVSIIPADGGEPRLLVPVAEDSSDILFPTAWSPDGKGVIVAGFEEASAIQEVAVDDGSVRTLVGGDGYTYHFPQWVTPAPAPPRPETQQAAGLWTSCGPNDQSDADLDKYFLRDVAAMEELGLPVYWLGTEFTVDGSVFRGPYGAEFGGEVDGGIGMTYLASLERGNTSLELVVRSRAAWAGAEERVRDPGLPDVTRRTVTVGDREAELISIPLGTRPVNTLWLVLDLGDVVVLGQALAGGAAYPGGPDYNPFINNPDLLIQVMQGLRPYPQ